MIGGPGSFGHNAERGICCSVLEYVSSRGQVGVPLIGDGVVVAKRFPQLPRAFPDRGREAEREVP